MVSRSTWGLVLIGIITLGVLIWACVTQAQESFARSDPKLRDLRDTCAKVDPRIANLPLYSAKKSYTINKEKTYLCLYDEKGALYPDYMLRYVLLHEFAHVLNHEIGHPPSFTNKFNELLNKAVKLQILPGNNKTGELDTKGWLDTNYCMYSDDGGGGDHAE